MLSDNKMIPTSLALSGNFLYNIRNLVSMVVYNKTYNIPMDVVSNIGACQDLCSRSFSNGSLACPKTELDWNRLAQAEGDRDPVPDGVGATGVAYIGAYKSDDGRWLCADGEAAHIERWESGQPDSGKDMCDIVELCSQITFNAEILEVNDIACNIEGQGFRPYVQTGARCACEEATAGYGPAEVREHTISLKKCPN